mgnify:CR=1 FL=1
MAMRKPKTQPKYRFLTRGNLPTHLEKVCIVLMREGFNPNVFQPEDEDFWWAVNQPEFSALETGAESFILVGHCLMWLIEKEQNGKVA